jgi:hypothetical protein
VTRALVLALVLAGCNDYPATGAEVCDNGIDDDLNGLIDCVDPACNGVAPCIPQRSWRDAPAVAAPVMTCPSGWRVVTDAAGGADTCDPYPSDGPAMCSVGEAHFPGEPECRPIGHACPTGDFPDDVPSTNVWYVRTGVSGDGTRAHPFATLASAIAAASLTDGLVVVARGTYTFTPPNVPVHIRGACVAGTTLNGFAQEITHALTLEDVTLAHAGTLLPNDDLTMRGVLLDAPPNAGLIAIGPFAVELEDVVIQNVSLPMAVIGMAGEAIGGQGADIRLNRVIIDGAYANGIVVSGGIGSLTASDLVVRNVHVIPNAGAGVGVQATVPLSLSRVLVENVVEAGLIVGSSGTITDLVVRNVANGDGGAGIAILQRATVDARRVLVDGADRIGVAVQAPASATLHDLVVRGTRSATFPRGFGRGVHVDGARVSLDRVSVESSAEIGLVATDLARLTITDVRVRDAGLAGIAVFEAGATDVERAIVESGRGAGLAAVGRGATLIAADVLVSGTSARADGTLGVGVIVQDHAFAQIDHGLVVGSASIGVLALGAQTDLVAGDLSVQQPHASGIAAFDGAQLTLARFAVDDAATCGLVLADPGDVETSLGTLGAPSGICATATDAAVLSAVAASIVYRGGGAFQSTSAPAAPTPFVLPPVLML